jgi:tetratricopeptide (TPR) repeat protein
MGREEEGLAEIKLAVELTPHAEHALLGLAKVLGERGHAELALPLFAELTEIDPAEPLYQSNLGNCYLLTGDSERAVEQFRIALELAPDVAQYHYMLGCAFADVRDYPQARACWERTLELESGHTEARHTLELLEGGRIP